MSEPIKNFDVATFIENAQKERSLSDQMIHHRSLALEAYRMIIEHSEATDEMLARYDLEVYEWVFDLIMYWPIYEMESDLEPEDLNHHGVQHFQIRDIIFQLGSLPANKKKVTFI